MSTLTCDHIHIRSTDPEKTAAACERMLEAQIIPTSQDSKPRITRVTIKGKRPV